MRYTDWTDELATLQDLRSDTFVGDADTPQPVCNLILALALVYNDFKDNIMASMLLGDVAPDGDEAARTPQRGMFNAHVMVTVRIRLGLFHELFALIKKHEPVTNEPAFLRTVNRLHPNRRSHWSALKNVALEQPSSSDFAKFLVMLRNTVVFHYDPQVIFRGYRRLFIDDQSQAPAVSLGDTMAETRFYFADAAAQDYVVHGSQTQDLITILGARGEIVRWTNDALNGIVTEFIKSRQ